MDFTEFFEGNRAATYAPSGQWIACLSANKLIIYDAISLDINATVPIIHNCTQLIWSPCCRFCAVWDGQRNYQVVLLDGWVICLDSKEAIPVTDIAFTSNGICSVTLSQGFGIKLFSLGQGRNGFISRATKAFCSDTHVVITLPDGSLSWFDSSLQCTRSVVLPSGANVVSLQRGTLFVNCDSQLLVYDLYLSRVECPFLRPSGVTVSADERFALVFSESRVDVALLNNVCRRFLPALKFPAPSTVVFQQHDGKYVLTNKSMPIATHLQKRHAAFDATSTYFYLSTGAALLIHTVRGGDMVAAILLDRHDLLSVPRWHPYLPLLAWTTRGRDDTYLIGLWQPRGIHAITIPIPAGETWSFAAWHPEGQCALLTNTTDNHDNRHGELDGFVVAVPDADVFFCSTSNYGEEDQSLLNEASTAEPVAVQ